MPIYAYRCEACGFAKDVLQKMSDDQLTVCPTCRQASFKKQVTAAGFQLKGTGWYVTDFRGGAVPGKSGGSSSEESAAPAGESKAVVGDSKTAAAVPAAASSPTAPTSVPASTSAAPSTTSKTPASTAT